MDRISQFFKGLMAYVGEMAPSQVMMLFGVIAGTVVGGSLLFGWVSDQNYASLYTNLDASEAGEVTSYLNEQKIPYKLSNGGRTIEVPSSDVYKTRIELASEGLPQSGTVGYSIFDQNNLGMTDFLQKLNFRRALEGELTRTIVQLDEVKAVRVHIVMPKDKLFKDDKKEATASIVLKLSTAGGLSKQQIKGITHLVASSVEGLKPSNITIIDYNGNLLTSGQESSVIAGLSSTQLDVQKQVESYLQEKAQSMLDDVLGIGKSVVRVTADLNFQQIERTSENFDANSPSIRSEEKIKTSATLSDKEEEAGETSSDNSTETTITNYELNSSVEHIINAVGTIQRLSLAVMVDGTYLDVEDEDGVVAPTYQPRTQDELDRLASIIKNSIGFDSQRNDQIEIVNIAFDRNNLQEERVLLDSMYMRDFYYEIAKKVGFFLLLAFGFLYFKKKAKKLFEALSKIVPPAPVRPVVAVADNSEEEVSAIERDEEVVSIPVEKRKPKLVDKMQKTASEQPEEIAKVIKTMMIE